MINTVGGCLTEGGQNMYPYPRDTDVTCSYNEAWNILYDVYNDIRPFYLDLRLCGCGGTGFAGTER